MTKEKNIDIKLSEVENFCKNADSRTVLNMLINYETFLAGLDLKIERFENAINQTKNQESIKDLKDFKEKQAATRKQCDILLDYIQKVCGDYDLIKYAIEKGAGK
jgi:acetyl-CoA carboxylase alpha subunit